MRKKLSKSYKANCKANGRKGGTMVNIIITDKQTGQEKTLETVPTQEQAENFCECWGWSYDDGRKTYYLGYEKAI